MFSPGSHWSLNNSSVMHSFVDSFFEGKKALVKERLMDSVRVIVDGLFEEMEHQQHQDGRRRSASPSPSSLGSPATVPHLMEKPVVDGVDVAKKKAQNSVVAAATAEESLKTNDKSAAATTTPLPPPTTTEDGDDLKKVAKKSLASATTTAISAPSPLTIVADSPSIAASGDSKDNSAASASAAAEEKKKEESLLKTSDKSAPTTRAMTTTTTTTAKTTPPSPPLMFCYAMISSLTSAMSSGGRSRETTPVPQTPTAEKDSKVVSESVSASAPSPDTTSSSSFSSSPPSIATAGRDGDNNKSAAEEATTTPTITPTTTTSTSEATTTPGSVASLSRNSGQNGPKLYERDELLNLRSVASDHAIIFSNQENLKYIAKKTGNNKIPSQADMLLPSFANSGGGGCGDCSNDSYRNKSQTQASRRPSQPSKNYQDQKSRKITSTSMHYGETQYKPAANGVGAWLPGQTKADDPVEAETEALLKSVRAILCKLTPQNYHTLLEQFKALKIDSRNRLSRVIGLIFDKAVKEPSFVVQYAGFCSDLVHIKVVETNEAGETAYFKFKNLLIEKCQETFFREIYSDIENYEERQREIEQCTDETKKKELEDIMDDDKKLSRRRSIGNIKLIAELFKLNMLNVRIMFSCIQKLLSHQHEEYVEVLCALITNIGGKLSSAIKNKPGKQKTFDDIFAKLTAIQRQEEGALKVNLHIRFTILDLLDLRKNNWISRRKVQGPKTIA
ncbi:Eukaryotic translation initiation factor 4 gamma [Tyrophagus putrescentiae]|nr:Eukaryotic translation initiation factor 4 gamma [Tyrophagus putrescentiae]